MYHNHVMNLLLYAIALAAIIVEIGWYFLIRRERYPWKELFASLGVFVLRIPSRAITLAVIGSVSFLAWSLRPFTVPLDSAWGVLLLFLAVDLAYYWAHRADHAIRWMWATHVVHHTPERLHFASAFRLGATGLVSGSWILYLPLPFLGFHPLAVGGMQAINLFYQFWLHTEVIGRLGPLESIFNTPSHHRVHHASNEQYLDRNFGGILIIWDKLFGTFARENPRIAIRYGLVEPIGTINPLKLLFHEWQAMIADFRDAPSWRRGVRLAFGRPGLPLRETDLEMGAPVPQAPLIDGRATHVE